MKKLLSLILLIVINVTILQTTVQAQESKPTQLSDSLSIPPAQIDNVYIGLKQGEAYRLHYAECLQTAKTLNNIIQDMSREAEEAAAKTKDLNRLIADRNADLTDKEVEIQILKDKKIPWYRHPITAGILGIALGVYIAN